ncbi:hypothetical protein GYMLUDRAFT_263761 [Collybiopsis luxurians FD-317 M1]|uniref:Uncharacterized protein n=1 Tax=Collybiopsis luxurians FD-317 M1 TaxID=944289 RepID=A0A0D0BMW1_9AGAR|nr:hypothetical protein GYMLUDRAFT_263761 [Collybiopsis luxurians FD-317 M1]
MTLRAGLWRTLAALLLLTVSSIPLINASPVNALIRTGPGLLYRRTQLGKITVGDDDEFVGLRYVDKPKADEYNDAGTLTAIPAGGKTLGEGSYLSPQTRQPPPMTDPWVCIVFGSRQKLHAPMIPKLKVSFADLPSQIHENDLQAWLQNYVSDAAAKYNLKNEMKYGQTLLFSAGQMVVPSHFLVHSKSYPQQASGTNSLGLKVHCVRVGRSG